jgi:hypothetical protein
MTTALATETTGKVTHSDWLADVRSAPPSLVTKLLGGASVASS